MPRIWSNEEVRGEHRGNKRDERKEGKEGRLEGGGGGSDDAGAHVSDSAPSTLSTPTSNFLDMIHFFLRI